MKIYTKKESLALRTHNFSATCKGTTTIVKAYVKENAFERLKKIDPSIKISDVRLSNTINSGGMPVDKLVEIDAYAGIFEIQMDESLKDTI